MRTNQLRCITSYILLVVFFFCISNSSFSQIDLSKPVGSTAGAASVSATGGVTYVIPIDILKGTNGMEPKVNLSYNSQGGEGIAGFGWNLSAYSIISRQGKRNYYNGNNTPVTYTNDNDAFALDGQRLFPTSGNNGDNGTVYGTENETFSKIESFGGSNTYGPDWFKVTTRDGMVMEYGTDYSSKLLTDNWNSAMFWLLKRVTDKSGNFYEYTYSINQTDRNFALTEINYTGNANAGLQPYNKIEFTYSVLSNWQNRKVFEGGSSIISPFLLDQIHIKNDVGTTVKSYQCGYTIVKNQYFLSTFTETGSDGSTLNPLTFQYGSSTYSPEVSVSGNYTGFNGNNTYTGDVTGDGQQDVIAARYYYDNNGVPHYTAYDVVDYFGSYGGQSAISLAYTYNIPQAGATQVQGSSNGYYNFLTYDYDGDSKQDVLMISNAISGGGRRFNGVKINYSRKYSWWSGYQTVDYPQIPYNWYDGYFQYVYNQGTYYIPGDFDGDGAQDYILILGLYNSTYYYRAFFSSPAKNIINQEIANFGVGPSSGYYATTVASASEVMPIDFDGDGKMEILVQKPGASYILSVYPEFGIGTSYAATVKYTFSDVLSGYKVFPGDFNGDGKTDLLVRTSPNNPYASWNILYSTGTQYKSYPFYFQNRPYLDGDNGGSAHHIVVADFNNDGKSDIWHALDQSSSSSKHTLFISNGVPLDYNNSTSAFSFYNYYASSSINRNQSVQSVIGDFNFDGKPDIFSINGTTAKIIYPQPNKEENLMVSSTNGLGAQTQFSYTKGYNRSWVYDYDNPSTPLGQGPNGNPYTVLKTPMYVAEYLMEPNGLGWYNYTSMQYEDAMYHPFRGFLGFKKVSSLNNTTGINTTTYSEMNNNFYLPEVYKTTTDYWGTPLTETDITNNLVTVNPGNYLDKRYVNEPSGSKSFNYVNGSGSETANTYDSYGNITNSTANVGPFTGTTISPVETVNTATTFVAASSTPVPSLPANITVTKTRINQSAVTKTSAYTYYSNGIIYTATDFSGTPLAAITYYFPDQLGNMVFVAGNAPNTLMPSVINNFDSKGRYLTSKITSGSGINKTETYTYNILNDQIASATSSDGLTTTYTYDGYGRVTQTGMPDGNTIVTSYDWEQYTGRYSTTSYRAVDGGKWGKKYLDILGREIREETNGFNDQLVSTTDYDYQGLVYQKVEPHYSGETGTTITTTYDYLQRLSSVSNGSTTTNYSYSLGSGGLFTTTVTNGANQSTSKTADASGKVIQSNDNGGQLDYTYDSWGNQLEVKFGSTSLIVNTYDNYGRNTSVTDKNAGTISYQYNALGKLTQQTDANNNVTTINYDAFGRVLSKTSAAGTTSYNYYNDAGTGYCNNNITSVTGFAGDTKTYQYDNLQRVISESTGVNGQTFTKTMGYDGVGNLISTTYPSGITINDAYNINGIPTQTLMTYAGNTQTLFTASAMNSKGVYTSYDYGNGKSSTVNYDLVNGTPTQYYTQGIQDLNFSFDNNTGNLLSRYDGVKNLNETFSYDYLNRLTDASVNNVQQFSMTYDGSTNNSLGNIQSKSDIGNYRYDAQKINALRFLTTNTNNPTDPPNVISVNTQTLTYTPFLKTSTISENGYQMAYTYGEDEERIKSVLTQYGNPIETKYYLGAYEVQTKGGATREIHYISAGNGSCAIIVKEGGQVTPYFVYTDHLGSLLTITDVNGNVVTEQNFDAWGRNRNPNDWSYNSIPTVPDWLYRGFTGHEHVKEFALINMNGRMYDPVTCRMLSPDNYVPMPWNTQGYNRYGYGNNNPLIYRDPNGEFIHLLIGALIGSVVNVAVAAIHGQIHSFWDGVKAAAIGAAEGAVGAAIGFGGFGSGAWASAQAAGYNTASSIIGNIATGIGSSFLPSIPIGDHFSISPSFAFGSHGLSSGLSANYHSGNFSLGVGFSNTGSESRFSGSAGWDDGKTGLSYTFNHFSGGGVPNQNTGTVGFRAFGSLSGSWENDRFAFFSGGQDRWRTNGMGLGWTFNDGSQLYFGSRFVTGEALDAPEDNPYSSSNPIYTEREGINAPRQGLFYGGFTNSRGINISGGIDSEKGLHSIQNGMHDFLRKYFNGKDWYFPDLHRPLQGFYRYGNANPFTYFN